MKNILLLLLPLLLAACVARKPEDSVLKRAAEFYRQSIAAEKALQPKLDQLVQYRNSINVQGRALRPDEIAFVEEVDRVEADLMGWQENFVGVPGHGPDGQPLKPGEAGEQIDMTPEDALALQEGLFKNIQTLAQRVETALDHYRSLTR